MRKPFAAFLMDSDADLLTVDTLERLDMPYEVKTTAHRTPDAELQKKLGN